MNFVVYCLALVIAFPFRVLPYRLCLGLGKLIAVVLSPFGAKYHRIIAANLTQAFPEKSPEWIAATTRRSWRHMGILLADSLFGPRMDQKFFDKHCVFDPGAREAEEAAFKRPGGVICNCGHLGSWELLVHYTGRILHGGGVYKKLSNGYIDRWYKKMREVSGIELFEVAESSQIIRYLRAGGRVGFVSDQNAGHTGIFVDFMHRPASTFKGPALMAGMSRSSMLFYSAVHGADGKIHLRVRDLGVIDLKKFTDRETALRHYTEMWVQALEEEIRLYPEQYLWAHQRWKTSPDQAVQIRLERRQKGREKSPPA